jgi:O-antigen/teichoic acid export membrane protein
MARDSFIMVGAGLASSLFAYLYQLFMGIVLPLDEYGVLLSLTSLFVIIGVLTQTITFVAAKSTSGLAVEGRLGAVNYLWQSLTKRTIIIGVVAFGIAAAVSPLVSRFLNIGSPLYFMLIFCTLIFAFALAANWGVMQGLQRFSPLGLSQALWGFARFALGAMLVYAGFGLVGGLAAFPLSYVLVLGVTFLLLRNLSQGGNEKVRVNGVSSYAWFILLAVFAITMLTNFDVVLAKHYLPSEDAGSYSIISVFGRIAFYAPAGIGLALFPKSAVAYDRGGNHRRLFLIAVWLTLATVVVICLGYALLSAHVIGFHFTDRYSEAIPYLFKYGLGMSFLAISSLVMTYFLSFGKTAVAYPLLAAMILQVALIGFFHSSIDELVNIMLISGTVSSVLILPFYWRVK